jgi:hypothetical protein
MGSILGKSHILVTKIRPMALRHEDAILKGSESLSRFTLATICLVTITVGYLFAYKLSPLAMLYQTCLIISFYLIGAGLKFVDEAYDRNRFSKNAAHFLLALGTVAGVALTLLDIWAASIFLALLIALALTGKVNRRLYFIPPLVFFFLLVALGKLSQLHWAFVAVATTAALADELGAEFAKSHFEESQSPEASCQGRKKADAVTLYILRNRFIALSVLLGLAIIEWLPFVYWFAWVGLDFGYTVVEAISSRLSLISSRLSLCLYVYMACYAFALLRAFW